MKKEWIEAKDIPQQYFEVGQTVYSSMFGEGIVNSILGNHETYPILVDFNNKTTRISYTLEGRRLHKMKKLHYLKNQFHQSSTLLSLNLKKESLCLHIL
jgi:hypothetical protein